MYLCVLGSIAMKQELLLSFGTMERQMSISADIIDRCVMMQPEWKNTLLHNELR